jgi:hypothetical protein
MENPDWPPTWTSQYLGTVEPSQDPNYLNKRVLILMRGVDVHSPSIDMKIDLSRIFGKWIYDWGPGYYSERYVLEGKFKMNIPVQASYSTAGANSMSCSNHYLFSSNNGSTSGGGYDKTTKSSIFYKSYLFEYKSVGQNSFQNFASHMHKYYSGVGPSLIDGYTDLSWNLGTQQSTALALVGLYKELVLNSLWASGSETNTWAWYTQNDYSISSKNLTVSESNFYRKRFFDL